MKFHSRGKLMVQPRHGPYTIRFKAFCEQSHSLIICGDDLRLLHKSWWPFVGTSNMIVLDISIQGNIGLRLWGYVLVARGIIPIQYLALLDPLDQFLGHCLFFQRHTSNVTLDSDAQVNHDGSVNSGVSHQLPDWNPLKCFLSLDFNHSIFHWWYWFKWLVKRSQQSLSEVNTM